MIQFVQPKIIAVLAGEGLLAQAKKAKQSGADVVEVRADTIAFSNGPQLKKKLLALRRSVRLPILLTLRAPKEQGPVRSKRQWNEMERTALFAQLLDAADWIDIELSSKKVCAAIVPLAKKKKKKIILSAHNFARVPTNKELQRLCGQFQGWRGDWLKIAAQPKKMESAEAFLCAMQNLNVPMIAIAMGKEYAWSRKLGFLFGSKMTYGSVLKAAAPGQIAVEELSAFYKGYFG